ncbi:hypothetical protein [Chelatococcus sp. XZ-Ab1]|uniref:phage fiber-tail adaptor protein n=1 Tax=Chelatococcus sp. XZ-Ab1 TaxID=3034027 RepID=UPI0023E433EF|nr:hypothetical protein [Chelatococcus sp. XZ-Ab1]
MMPIATFFKDPDDVLDYDVDLARWLPEGDVIVSAVSLISDGSAFITATEPTDTTVRVWVSGGTSGTDQIVTVRATTEQGRVKDVSFRLRIRSTAP